MLITLLVALIILAYFFLRAARFGKLKAAGAGIMAVFSIGITAYFILFIVTGL